MYICIFIYMQYALMYKFTNYTDICICVYMCIFIK